MALVSATKASKVLLNTALEVSKDATKKVEEIFPGAAEQACMMASKAANASQKMGEKAGERIIDAAAQAAANPCKAAAVIAGAAGVTMIAAPALVAIPTLGALGFSASGPVAGGIAATVQSGIGSVVAPSLFATCQSAAMGGYGVATVFGAVQAGGGFMAGSAGTVLWMKSKQAEKDDSNGGTAVATSANAEAAMPNASESGYEGDDTDSD